MIKYRYVIWRGGNIMGIVVLAGIGVVVSVLMSLK
jgi:hypothetical protein